MFRGRYETTLDAKGRTSLPARFRDVLAAEEDDRMVLTTGLEGCLVGYTYGAWRRFEERLAGLPSFDPNVTRLKRLYVASAVECPVDGHGRILVPGPLRGHAGLEKNAVWCGLAGYVELWDAERWQRVFAEALEGVDQLGRALADLGL